VEVEEKEDRRGRGIQVSGIRDDKKWKTGSTGERQREEGGGSDGTGMGYREEKGFGKE